MTRAAHLFSAAFAGLLQPVGVIAAAAALMPAPAASAMEAQRGHPYAAFVAEAARRFDIPETWIWRVMHAESRGDPRAVSRAGAMGLMQIMPATWAMLSARHQLGTDPFDARANILGGAAYLRAMWDRYRDVSLMLAAYNAGPGRADAYAAGRRRLPVETIAYVAAIAPSLGAVGDISPARARTPGTPDWRGAAIFAARPSRPEAGADAAVAAPGNDTPAAPSEAIARPPTSIFVARSVRGE